MIPRPLTLAFGCASLLALAACTSHDDEPTTPIGFRQTSRNHTTTVQQQTTTLPDDNGLPPEPTPPPTRRQTTQITENAAPPTSAPSGPQDYPYGIPVKDKPGYVTSPYAPDSGYVDVHGFTTGQEVRDPYTQKIFLVP